MGFSSAVTALQTTGAYANTSILGFGGGLYIVHGTYDMDGDAAGEIVTGLSLVHAGNISIDTKVSSGTIALNDDGTGTESLGSIGIIAIDDIEGQWWAIGSL